MIFFFKCTFLPQNYIFCCSFRRDNNIDCKISMWDGKAQEAQVKPEETGLTTFASRVICANPTANIASSNKQQ